MGALFDAATDELRYNAATFDYNSTYTMMCWARTSNYALQNRLIEIGASTSNRDIIILNNSPNARYTVVVGGTNIEINYGTVVANTWYHFCVKRTAAAALYGYQNAVIYPVNTKDATGRTAMTALVIGNEVGANTTIACEIAHCKVWTAALSDLEIAAEMRQIAPARTADLWACWPLLSGALTTDTSGNGRTLGNTGVTDGSDPGIPLYAGDPLNLMRRGRRRYLTGA